MKTSKFIILSLITSGMLIQCTMDKIALEKGNYTSIRPPNAIRLDSNLFYDQSEISNFHWLEYMYWIGHVFGKESNEFKASHPDTNVWAPIDTCNGNYVDYYLKHPAYRANPVVGVSYQQALSFAKWRADRVMEYLLIKSNYLDHRGNQSPEDYFSIERLANGEIETKKPVTSITHYPHFRLPTEEEWRFAMNFNDSIMSLNKRKIQMAKKRTFKHTNPIIDLAEICIDDTLRGDYTDVVLPKYGLNKVPPFFLRLQGNVREMTSVKGLTVGGGWCDSLNIIKSQDLYYESDSTSNCVGIRYISEWRKMEKPHPNKT